MVIPPTNAVMMVKLNLTLIIVILVLVPAAQAQQSLDCGPEPLDTPQLPDGTTTTRGDLSSAVAQVRAYSGAVDTFLSCMDTVGVELLPYMTKEQQERWDDDLNSLHERRVDLQKSMNEEIRTFNSRLRSNDGSG